MANCIPTLVRLDRHIMAAEKNRKKVYYKYTRALTESEIQVQNRGYPFVCTIELAPKKCE